MNFGDAFKYNENTIKQGELLGTAGNAIQATSNGGVGNVLGKMGQFASMGSAFGGVGMGVGAAVGLATGLIDNKRIAEEKAEQERKEKEAKAKMDYMRSIQMAASANPNGSVYGNNLFAFGGELPVEVNNNNSQQLASNAAVMQGARHEQGGINVGNNNEVEGEEVVVGNKVFSTRLEKFPGYTFATAAEHIANTKGSIEKDLATETDIYKKAALNRLISAKDAALDKLFNEQEEVKQQLMQAQSLQQQQMNMQQGGEQTNMQQEGKQMFWAGGTMGKPNEPTSFETALQNAYNIGQQNYNNEQLINNVLANDPNVQARTIDQMQTSNFLENFIPEKIDNTDKLEKIYSDPVKMERYPTKEKALELIDNTSKLGENSSTADITRNYNRNLIKQERAEKDVKAKQDLINSVTKNAPTKMEQYPVKEKALELKDNSEFLESTSKDITEGNLLPDLEKSKLNEVAARLGTSVDNIVNSILIDKTPQIPTPLLQDPVFMKSYMDVSNAVRSIKDSNLALNKSLDANVSNSAVARSNKLAAFLQEGKQLSDLYTTKENTETGLMNNNLSMLNQVEAQNLSALNNYNINKANREAGMLQDKAGNVANAQDDLMWNVQRTDQEEYQREQLVMTALKDTTGVFGRKLITNDQTIQSNISDDINVAKSFHDQYIKLYKTNKGKEDLEVIRLLEKLNPDLEKFENEDE